jgi:uncharacterized protein with HEPN domain
MPRSERVMPASPDDRSRLSHALTAARECVGFVAGRTRSDLDSDRMFCRAVVSAIQEIGEACAKTTDIGRSRVVGVSWGQIVEMRHIIVHIYWGVDLDIVWQTATEDLPAFIGALESALAKWPQS